MDLLKETKTFLFYSAPSAVFGSDPSLPKGFLGIQRSNSPTYHTDPPGFNSALSHNKKLQRNPNTKILNQNGWLIHVSLMIIHARKLFFRKSASFLFSPWSCSPSQLIYHDPHSIPKNDGELAHILFFFATKGWVMGDVDIGPPPDEAIQYVVVSLVVAVGDASLQGTHSEGSNGE
ncbi:uncharacterized protein CLUP02_02789 [Colletotrichum lupini]|uniref:Uncharacterized protein n=1 Tax=Colletotrichum lupini TaxID=145971 RepID=A0A9Q8SI34_9PEZI|nr:uncharacterized protein CLUP02_02789 [Colletotrichum lupini]UQC77321.1 hypothetical protein CLUP02_02789 [Colletotrichum lupini]